MMALQFNFKGGSPLNMCDHVVSNIKLSHDLQF